MDSVNTSRQKKLSDYNFSVRILTCTVILIVLILTVVYFIRIYSDTTQGVKKDMRSEANIIEATFTDEIIYSEHNIRLIARQIQGNYKNIKRIQKILFDYTGTSSFTERFGWRKYSWVDKNFKETVDNKVGIKTKPKKLEFIKNLIKDKDWQNRLKFYPSKTTKKNSSLKLVSALADPKTGDYSGAVVLSYNIATMIHLLQTIRKNEYTNFLVLNDDLQVVLRSKPNIPDIIDKNEVLSPELLKKIKAKQLESQTKYPKNEGFIVEDASVFGGVNHFIKKIKGYPFILVVNIDSPEIKNNIAYGVIKKFLEISFIAAVFLTMVISIYKRETWLRSKAEQASFIANKATNAKSDFLAFAAHEIRSPLGFILTGSEIMTKELFGTMPEAYKQYAAGIFQNSKVILDFITDILDENQILAGKFNIKSSIVDIEEVIKKSIQGNKARFSKRRVEIIYKHSAELPKLICDERRILQVMNNLISNAINYSNDNTKVIVQATHANNQLKIEIIDQGIGMNEEEIKTALSSSGTPLKRNQGLRGHNFIVSYGLGLPIVRMLLNAHDAELTISSKPDIGTTVTIIIPQHKLIYENLSSDNIANNLRE